MSLHIVPMTISKARQFIGRHHRHNRPPVSALFALAVAEGETIVGVGMVGRPVARRLQDGVTAEITRVCTIGHKNSCSMLYGAAVRACRVLGYRRVITYTLQSESGASLRASGALAEPATVRNGQSWDVPSRRREDRDLFECSRPQERKTRWEWRL